jgi:hypothetical protein
MIYGNVEMLGHISTIKKQMEKRFRGQLSLPPTFFWLIAVYPQQS